MPPLRLPALSNPSIRAFSSSAAISGPLREAPYQFPRHHASSSSSSSSSSPSAASSSSSSSNRLLSITNPDRQARTNSTNSNSAFNPAPRKDTAIRLLNRLKDRAHDAVRSKQAQIEVLRNQKNSTDYLKQMPRRWNAGDVYSPHDMSPVEMQKWRRRSPRSADVVDALGIRPLDMYKNFSLVQEFTSSSGQITHSSGTSLRPVNQRKIAKMIRRVQGMGLYPTIHDHPEMIRDNFFPVRR